MRALLRRHSKEIEMEDAAEVVINGRRITGWPATIIVIATLAVLMAGPATLVWALAARTCQ